MHTADGSYILLTCSSLPVFLLLFGWMAACARTGCFRLPVEAEVGESDGVNFDVSFLIEVTHVPE